MPFEFSIEIGPVTACIIFFACVIAFPIALTSAYDCSYSQHTTENITISNTLSQTHAISSEFYVLSDNNKTYEVLDTDCWIRLRIGHTYNVDTSSSPFAKNQRIDKVNYEV